MNALQQLQQEMSKVATSPKEYEQMVLAMQEADKFAKQTNTILFVFPRLKNC